MVVFDDYENQCLAINFPGDSGEEAQWLVTPLRHEDRTHHIWYTLSEWLLRIIQR